MKKLSIVMQKKYDKTLKNKILIIIKRRKDK